jgi:hypothetical protein
LNINKGRKGKQGFANTKHRQHSLRSRSPGLPYGIKQMKKTGRPPLGEKKKTNRVGVFLTAEEFAKIQLQAERARLTEADYLRKCGLKKVIAEPPARANFEGVKAINAIGRNLNTVARGVAVFQVEDGQKILNVINQIQDDLQAAVSRLWDGEAE